MNGSTLDDAAYARLAAMREEASAMPPVADSRVVFEAAAFVHHEARLIDARAFDAWLALFSDDGIYWLPTDEGADPRTSVSLWLDDRRRIEDRIVRFKTGFAYSQSPARRLRRVIGNVEAWDIGPDERRVLSNQIVHEHRAGHAVVVHVAQVDHVLVRHGDRWRIAIKRCVLVNGPDPFELPTLL